MDDKEDEFFKIQDFFKEKGVILKCEMCGSENFGIRSKISEHSFPAIVSMPNYPMNGVLPVAYATIPYIQSICINCGNTKFFERTMFDQWIEGKKNG